MARIIRLEFVHVERACRVATPRFSKPKNASISSENVAVFVQPVIRIAQRSHNADRPMNPASVMKLVTTYAALRSWVLPIVGKPKCIAMVKCEMVCSGQPDS